MTTLDNLLVGMHTFGWDRTRQELELTRVLEVLPDLRDLMDTPAGLLSGGEQQMLALAKALVLRPSVLLVDELSLGLAPLVVGRLLAVIEAVRDTGVAIVLVEQSLNVAAAVADRAIFLDRGRVVFEGAPADLLDRPDLARAVFLTADARV
jgi:branched-chain amino acid transport system ATP-binding protein